ARSALVIAGTVGVSRPVHAASTARCDRLHSVAIAILSPHLDDAVLSCWHLLTRGGDVTVINVFTGAPADSVVPAWWDELTGATDSAQRIRERIAEDRAALSLARRTSTNLGFLDEQYR